jgi:DNA invertase Pin-like site-specific DNA recombinase
LGRSLKDLVEKVEELKKRSVGFRSLQESIDTTSSVGKFQFHVFSALAEFERNLIRDRTMAGLRAARARGRRGGRKHLLTPDQIGMAARLIKSKEVPVSEICKILKVSRPTLYRYVSPTGDIRNDGKKKCRRAACHERQKSTATPFLHSIEMLNSGSQDLYSNNYHACTRDYHL